MINFDNVTEENTIKPNLKWPDIPDLPNLILIIGGSGSEKRNKKLIKRLESVDLNHYNDPNAFIEYLNDMLDFHKNIDEYNQSKIWKLLIVFDMIADILVIKTSSNNDWVFYQQRKTKHFTRFHEKKMLFKVPKDDKKIKDGNNVNNNNRENCKNISIIIKEIHKYEYLIGEKKIILCLESKKKKKKKLSFLIHQLEKDFKSKQKQLRIKEMYKQMPLKWKNK